MTVGLGVAFVGPVLEYSFCDECVCMYLSTAFLGVKLSKSSRRMMQHHVVICLADKLFTQQFDMLPNNC